MSKNVRILNSYLEGFYSELFNITKIENKTENEFEYF